MYKISNILIIFFFLISSFFTKAYSSDSIRFINLDLIIQNTISGKSLLASIELDRDKKLNDFKNKETNLKNKEKKIINQKNILSKEDFDAKLIQLNKELTEYNKNKKKAILDFENSKKIKIENYFNKISPYIQDYVKKKSIGIVINKQNIFIASKDFDITSDIIKLIDLNFKE